MELRRRKFDLGVGQWRKLTRYFFDNVHCWQPSKSSPNPNPYFNPYPNPNWPKMLMSLVRDLNLSTFLFLFEAIILFVQVIKALKGL